MNKLRKVILLLYYERDKFIHFDLSILINDSMAILTIALNELNLNNHGHCP